MFKNKLAFTVVTITAMAFATFAEAARVDDINIKRIRAYNDGNAHIDLSRPISPVCGSRLRVPNKPGQDSVMKLATAALLSGNRVAVESEDARSGNFCNLEFIWLQAR